LSIGSEIRRIEFEAVDTVQVVLTRQWEGKKLPLKSINSSPTPVTVKKGL